MVVVAALEEVVARRSFSEEAEVMERLREVDLESLGSVSGLLFLRLFAE